MIAGVDDDELHGRRQRHAFDSEGPRVEEQRFAVASEAGGHLVHDADRRADEVGFRRLGDLREASRHRNGDRAAAAARAAG